MSTEVQNTTSSQHDAKMPVSGCRQGDLCIICGEEIDSDYGSVCSDCDDSHLDDCCQRLRLGEVVELSAPQPIIITNV